LIGGSILLVLVGGIVAAIALTGGGGTKQEARPSTGPGTARPAASGSGPATSHGPSPAPSTSASPAELPPPTGLSGPYNVAVKVAKLGSKIRGIRIGETRHSSWLLSTDCSKRPCTLHLIGETRDGSKIDATGPFVGRTVKGSATAGLRCVSGTSTLFEYDQTHGSFTIHVTQSERVAGIPQASAFRGSISFAWAPPAGKSTPGCEATSETDTVTGELQAIPLPEPLAPGAPVPPVSDGAVVGSWDTTLHVEIATGLVDRKPGDDLNRLFVFIPKCTKAATCGLKLIRESGDGISTSELTASGGGRYSERDHQKVACGSGTAVFSQAISVAVADARLIGGVWRATSFSGAFTTKVTPSAGTKGCRRTLEKDRLSGTLQA
jgi:hypothetical protein